MIVYSLSESTTPKSAIKIEYKKADATPAPYPTAVPAYGYDEQPPPLPPG